MIALPRMLNAAVVFWLGVVAGTNAFAQAGALDPTFDPGVGANGPIYKLALQPDGKIIAVGNFTEFNGQPRSRIVRLTANGSIDETFDPGTGADNVIWDVAVRNEAIVVVGWFNHFNDQPRGALARLNMDGSLHPTVFSTGGGDSIAILSNGKVVVGGIGGYGIHRGVYRFLPTGEIDEAFAIAIDRPDGEVFALAVQPDDETVFGGFFSTVNGEPHSNIARANADGTLDSFRPPYEAFDHRRVYALAIARDERIFSGGYVLSRINHDGSLDESFARSRFNGDVGTLDTIAVQQDGKPIVGGFFSEVSEWETGVGGNRNHVARFNDDGSLDENFGAGLSLADHIVQTVAIQPDGRILIGGLFENVNGVPRSRIARLLGDEPVIERTRVSSNQLVLSWPSAYTNHVLQSCTSFSTGDWMTVSNAAVASSGGMNRVTNEITSSGAKFFRLMQQ